MNYGLLKLKIIVGNRDEVTNEFNKWIASHEGKGPLTIVEKSFHTSSTNMCHRCTLELWYHVSNTQNHEKALIYCDEGSICVPMDLPLKSKEFRVGNMKGHSLKFFGNLSKEQMRYFKLKKEASTCPTIQLPFEDAKDLLLPERYCEHDDYVPEDNEV